MNIIPPRDPCEIPAPFTNEDVVAALKHAKSILWDGEEDGPLHCICLCLVGEDLIPDDLSRWLRKEVIEPRLGDHTYYTEWYKAANGIKWVPDEEAQAGRHAWLDALIEEFSTGDHA